VPQLFGSDNPFRSSHRITENKAAIISIICSLIGAIGLWWAFIPVVSAIPGVLFGIYALRRSEDLGGRGLAIISIIIGGVSLALAILGLFAFYPALSGRNE